MSEDKKVLRLPTDSFVGEIAKSNKLFHDQFGEAYIAVNGNGSKVLNINSRDFVGWLNNYAYYNYRVILKNNQATDIRRALEGFALYGKDCELSLEPRLRKIGDKIWYDLGEKAVRISSKGWEVVENPPIIFRRFSHQKAQVEPVKGGNIQSFRKFTNIVDEKDWNLFLAFVVACFIPDIPKPVLVINGSQGAGKSTPMRMLKDLADPSQLVSAGKITNEAELARLANRHILLFFDNLSFLEKDNSDVLCRLITGDGFSKRRLYSDDDEVIYNFKRPLMLNGINNFITQADLLDRALILNVERIPEEKRLTELELWGKFNEEKPQILGAIFTVLSQAMKIFPETPTSGLPRMADFGRWGCAIYSAINNQSFSEFQKLLIGNKERQIEESIEADSIAKLVKYMTNNLVRWKGSARDIELSPYLIHQDSRLEEIHLLSSHPNWPKDSSQIGKRLRRAEGMLKEANIEMTFGVENNVRTTYFVDRNYPFPENVPFMCFSKDGHPLTEDEMDERKRVASIQPEQYKTESNLSLTAN
ncbi:hypothetical protein IJG92_00040 [Candidatus Saccharibacteria bacterium]|nr:hypothetical protein [Candidatus Saccharibacteria bacterium]MBQ6570855.1 hypothetical protein [Candidatus Saccharibacteria bacterium]